MNNTPEQEIDCQTTTAWMAHWDCPQCERKHTAMKYGACSCGCGARFDVRKQPYASKTPAYVVMFPRQARPAYEVK